MLAIDPGSRRVGLAVSDESGTIAQPLPFISGEPPATLSQRLAERAAELEAEALVVGLPKRLDGRSGPEAQAARALADDLRVRTGLKVTLVDERLSTVQAERSLIDQGRRRAQRKQSVDSVAAALLLQTYLARQHGR